MLLQLPFTLQKMLSHIFSEIQGSSYSGLKYSWSLEILSLPHGPLPEYISMGGGWVAGDSEFGRKEITLSCSPNYTFSLLLCVAALVAPMLMTRDETDMGKKERMVSELKAEVEN